MNMNNIFNMMDIKNIYKTEYEYIVQTYPNISEYQQLDYLKQIIDYYHKHTKDEFKEIPIGWNVELYQDIILDEQEYDDYMENPLGNAISDSVVSCKKCKSSRTFNIEKQTRSLDEPSTIITICYDCKHRSKYSG